MNVSTKYLFLSILFLGCFNSYSQTEWVNFPYTKSEAAIVEAYDSASFEKIRGGWKLVKFETNSGMDHVKLLNPFYWEIYFERDSVYSLDYPYQYGSARRIISRPDTLLTLYNQLKGYPRDYHVQSVKFIDDTLVLTNHYGGGGMEGEMEYYVRKDYPFDSLLYLRKIRTDLNYLTGKWALDTNYTIIKDPDDSTMFMYSYFNLVSDKMDVKSFDFYPIEHLNFGSKENPSFQFNEFIIEVEVEDTLYQFEYIIEDSSISFGTILLRPITQCKCEELSIRYVRVDE